MPKFFSFIIVAFALIGAQNFTTRPANAVQHVDAFPTKYSSLMDNDARAVQARVHSQAKKFRSEFAKQRVSREIAKSQRTTRLRKLAAERRLARQKKLARQDRARRAAAKRARARARKRTRRTRHAPHRSNSHRRKHRYYERDCSQGAYDCNGFKNER